MKELNLILLCNCKKDAEDPIDPNADDDEDEDFLDSDDDDELSDRLADIDLDDAGWCVRITILVLLLHLYVVQVPSGSA